jgi:hypothetical protein
VVREHISLAVIALVWAVTAALLIVADHSAIRAFVGWGSCGRRLDMAEQMLGEVMAELSAIDPDRAWELARQYQQMVTLIPMIDQALVTDVERRKHAKRPLPHVQ